MKGLQTAGLSLVIASAVVVSAYAHHSAAGVDQTKTVTTEGIVKQFKWANPHAWLEVEAPNAKGGIDLWNFEMTSPTFLVRAGWKANTVKAGDKVTVVARPMKNGDPGGLFVSITLPSGQVLTQQAPRGGGRGPAGGTPGTGAGAAEQAPGAAATPAPPGR
jgi:hypothetical protein